MQSDLFNTPPTFLSPLQIRIRLPLGADRGGGAMAADDLGGFGQHAQFGERACEVAAVAAGQIGSADGTREEHPDHLHMLAHLGHKVTDGDKHHIVHHDGIAAHSHSIDEQGQHTDHGEHNTANEAREAMDKFLGEESEEPQHQHGEEENEEGPALGGM